MNELIKAVATLVKYAGGDYGKVVEVRIDAHNITVVQRDKEASGNHGGSTKTIIKGWRT